MSWELIWVALGAWVAWGAYRVGYRKGAMDIMRMPREDARYSMRRYEREEWRDGY